MIDMIDTKIVSGTPPRNSGAYLAMNSGSMRPVEAIAKAKPPTRISQVRKKTSRKRMWARAREAAMSATIPRWDAIRNVSAISTWCGPLMLIGSPPNGVTGCPRAAPSRSSAGSRCYGVDFVYSVPNHCIDIVVSVPSACMSSMIFLSAGRKSVSAGPPLSIETASGSK